MGECTKENQKWKREKPNDKNFRQWKLYVISPLFLGVRHSPKPGNVLLPSFAFCEVQESARDIKIQVINKYKVVCELSQHILYQYVFFIVWFAMVFGIVVSILGLFAKLIEHIVTITCFQKAGGQARYVLSFLKIVW